MPTSATKRALIVITVVVCVAAASVGIYLYRLHRPFAGSSAGPAPDILSELPAGAPAIAYIDVAALRKLQGSQLAAMLGLAGADPHEDREYADFVRDTGFDYARDLDRAAIAIWPANLLATPGGAGSSRAMAIADGRFDEPRLEAYALRTGKVVTRGTQSFYEVPGNPPVSFAFLSPTRIVLTNAKGLSILTTMPGASEHDAMRERIERVAGAPIFAVARTDTLPNSFYANFRNAPQFEHLARSVQGLTLAGQPDGDEIHVAVDAECDSMKNALELSTLLDGLRMFGSMALSDPKTRGQMTKQQAALLMALASRVKVTNQNKWVRLTLDITPEMLAPASPTHADPR
jgi:hypothetical protein